MRRMTLLFVLALLLLSVSLVSAAPALELNALARFYPADTLFLGSIRTDDGYIEDVDSLIQRVMAFLPPDQQVPFSLRDELNRAAADEGSGSFDEAIRPWLGDVVSVGMTMTVDNVIQNTDPTILVTAAVDGAGARTFFDEMTADDVAQGVVMVSEADGMKMYFAENRDMYIGITADTLFFSNFKTGLPVTGVSDPLSANASYNEILGLLPAADYNITMYVNTPILQELILDAAAQESSQPLPNFIQRLTAVNGAQIIGMTVLDGSTLTMDIAQKIDPAIYTDLGMQMSYPAELDPAFINRIPAGTPLAVVMSDFGPLLQSGYANLRVLTDTIDAQGGLIPLLEEAQIPLTESDRQSLQAFDPAMLLGMVNASFAGATGLSLENDFLPLFDGDAAAYIRAVPAQNFGIPLLPDLAFFAEASDTPRTAAAVESMSKAAEGFDLTWSMEDFGDGAALVIPAQETAGMEYPGLDLLLGAGNGVLSLGTREAATAALNAEGGLVNDAAYQAASVYFLPGTQVLFYLNSAPLYEAVDMLAAAQMLPPDPDTEGVYTLLSIIEHGSITAVTREDGSALVRMALTLGENPRPFPAGAGS